MDRNKLEATLNICDRIAMWLAFNFFIIDVMLFVLRIDNYKIYILWFSIPVALSFIYFVTAYILDYRFLGGE